MPLLGVTVSIVCHRVISSSSDTVDIGRVTCGKVWAKIQLSNKSNPQHILRRGISARWWPPIKLTAAASKRLISSSYRASTPCYLFPCQHYCRWFQVLPVCSPRKSKCKKGVSVSFDTVRGCTVRERGVWQNWMDLTTSVYEKYREKLLSLDAH